MLALHRYLGIALGLLMCIWCFSGFVMMYVQFPELTREEELRGLAALDLAGCCPATIPELLDAGAVESFRIEMLAGEPVIRIQPESGPRAVIRLDAGQPITSVGPELARRAAQEFLRHSSTDVGLLAGERLERDQWTVNGGFDRHRPLYRFRAEDAAGTEIHVSGTTGEVVQQSTAHERFWNWPGSIAHWIYPTVLRRHPVAWHYTVVLTSAAGVFLVAFGVYIGWQRYRRLPGRRWPYRGVALWHHYVGLLFGVLCLTWTFSGLMSMSPLGLLDSDGATTERRRLAGHGVVGTEVAAIVDALHTSALPSGTVRVESAPFAGELALIAVQASGESRRLAVPSLRPLPLSRAVLHQAAGRIAGDRAGIASAAMLDAEDSFYFGHHRAVALPVFRVVLDDPQQTRYYIDPETGRLLLKVDGARRWYRWLFEALHRGDFAPWIRQRPVWDIVMIALLTGVTLSSVTGTWMGLRRLRRRRSGARQQS